MNEFDTARALLREFKGDTYTHGLGVLPQVGAITASQGRRAVFIGCLFPGCDCYLDAIRDALADAGVTLVGETVARRPTRPARMLARITDLLAKAQPRCHRQLSAAAAPSTPSRRPRCCARWAAQSRTTSAPAWSRRPPRRQGKTLTPHVAIQTAASSAAHLTKYSNITDLRTGQKKLIIDMAIVPQRPIFDYDT